MPESLSGKVAAITGAASGIGLACARAMLEAGARVVLVDLAEDRLQSLCSELGKDAIPLVTNLLELVQRRAHDALYPRKDRTS